MSSHRIFGSRLAALFGILLLAGPGCKTYLKVPSFHIDASVPAACDNQDDATRTITVDDAGGVGAFDICRAIKWSDHQYLRWVPKTQGKRVYITFLLSKAQPEPFEQTACGPEDRSGTRLCFLQSCPDDCKTTFRADYKPFPKDDPRQELNYYYYSPEIGQAAAGSAKTGSDAGIRIDP